MDKYIRIKKRIVKTITKFGQELLSITPSSILVNIHNNSLVVMLENIISPAEENLAIFGKEGAKLLKELYSLQFGAIKSLLEKTIGEIMGQHPAHSQMTIDPDSKSGVIFFTFEKELVR
jgi:uncharacterized protein YbcI